jgi:hypothetical protein
MTESPKRKRTCAHSLNTIQQVAIEMARTYRRTKRGAIGTADGYRMVMMLASLKQCLESSEIEHRLAEIEAAIVSRDTVTHFRPKVVGDG